jgi:hypothetical protein
LLYQQQKIQQTEREINNKEKAITIPGHVSAPTAFSFSVFHSLFIAFDSSSPQPSHRGSGVIMGFL